MLMKKSSKSLFVGTAGVVILLLLISAVVVTVLLSNVLDQSGTASPDSAAFLFIQPRTDVAPRLYPEETVLRPLAVSVSSATHDWTGGDASSIGVIERIAHNPDEAIRMVEENERIHRRQLVYRKDTAVAAVQRARVTGECVSHLTLPALDGRELQFEVQRADLDPAGQSGSFAGRLVGKPDSMVILSFRGGREAFSVSSPSENLHIQADPREPGEIIVKAIDPATYIQGGCGNPEHNH